MAMIGRSEICPEDAQGKNLQFERQDKIQGGSQMAEPRSQNRRIGANGREGRSSIAGPNRRAPIRRASVRGLLLGLALIVGQVALPLSDTRLHAQWDPQGPAAAIGEIILDPSPADATGRPLLRRGQADSAANQSSNLDERSALTELSERYSGRPWDRAGLLGLLAPLDTTRLTAEQDTFVSEAHKSENYGRDKLLYVGGPAAYGKSYSYLWWDLNELPADQAITDARIELYLREAGPAGDSERTITAYPIDIGRFRDTTDCKDSWDERDVDWDDQPDRNDDVMDRTDVGTNRDRYSLKVTDEAIEWRRPQWNRDNRCNGGVVLHGDDRDGSFRGFDSSEGSNEPELRLSHQKDVKAPRAAMSPLPAYVSLPTEPDGQRAAVSLAWSGEDPDPGTGIDFFDLYGRANEGDWQLLAGQARTYGGRFIGENGVRYEFAIYPRDPAGNVKPPAPADAVTHLDFDAPVSTIDALPEFKPGPFELTWTGVDLPNTPGKMGSGIDYYQLHYNIGGGSWGMLADGLRENRYLFDTAQQGLLYQFRVIAVDRAGHHELPGPSEGQTTIDGLPPVVTIAPVNSIDNKRFVVQWTSVDPGGSGTVSVDLQLREDGGAWTDWATASTVSSRAFEGEFGHTYAFRARARDRAGNVGNWPEPPQLVTAVVERDSLIHAVHMPMVVRGQ
jgi:hypothetical protein